MRFPSSYATSRVTGVPVPSFSVMTPSLRVLGMVEYAMLAPVMLVRLCAELRALFLRLSILASLESCEMLEGI